MHHLRMFLVGFLTILSLVLQVLSSPTSSQNSAAPKSSSQASLNKVLLRDEEETELTPPPLLPSVAELLGAVIGANQNQVNRTIERLTLSHNGIDPDIPTSTKKAVTKEDANEEEEEEEEESNVLTR